MSTSLSDKLRALVALPKWELKPNTNDEAILLEAMYLSALEENARLAPTIERLINCVEKLEIVQHSSYDKFSPLYKTRDDLSLMAEQALRELQEIVGEG